MAHKETINKGMININSRAMSISEKKGTEPPFTFYFLSWMASLYGYLFVVLLFMLLHMFLNVA